MAMSNTSKMSALQDIAIYTYTEEVPLEDVLELIRKKEMASLLLIINLLLMS